LHVGAGAAQGLQVPSHRQHALGFCDAQTTPRQEADGSVDEGAGVGL